LTGPVGLLRIDPGTRTEAFARHLVKSGRFLTAMGRGGRPILAAALLVAGGCAEANGVLEVYSGPAAGRGSPVWAVHVGERARLTFRSRMGECDYAVMRWDGSGEYADCGAPDAGGFDWTHEFSSIPAGSGQASLTVTGYAQDGSRDVMPVRGRLEEHRRGRDGADLALAAASVVVRVYQSAVEIEVPAGESVPQWGLSHLTIRRSDGKTSRVGPAAGRERGFQVTGPVGRSWRVRYEPLADEVNASGETEAELVVADEAGRTRSVRASFATP
jgi:hypothetical protein